MGSVCLLVCGGRSFGAKPGEAEFLRQQLDMLRGERPGISVLIHGAQTGADSLAGEWARRNGIETLGYEVTMADWAEHGRAAGPMRNRRMIQEGRPDLVLAFPGDRGTRDMVRQARRAGIEVLELAVPE